MKSLRVEELSLVGGEISCDCLDVLMRFWFCPHLYSHYLGKWGIELGEGESARGNSACCGEGGGWASASD